VGYTRYLLGYTPYYLTDNKSLTILERLNSGLVGLVGLDGLGCLGDLDDLGGLGDIGDFPFIIAITFLYSFVPLRGEHQAGFPSLYIFNASKYFII
jgi:hypothetical protein